MKPSRAIAIGIALLFAWTSPAAQTEMDSLWQLGRNTRLPDTVRLAALHHLGYRYVHNDPDSARMAGQAQLALAREKELPNWQARALNIIGLSYRYQSRYDAALQHYEQSIALLEKTGDRNYMSAVYGNMGGVFQVQSNFPKALECLSKSLALAEETGDRKKMADGYIGIAIVYFETPDNEAKALEYLQKALDIYEALNNRDGLALAYGNLSTVYLELDDLDKALYYNNKALDIQEKDGNLFGAATSLHNRAVIRSFQGRYEEALADFDREVAIFKTIGDEEGLADAYNSMGDLWLQQQRYPLAIQMCRQGLDIGRRIGRSNLRVIDACACLYNAYRQQGQYKQALEYLEQFIAAKDSLQKDETAQKLRQMELQRQSAIDSLSREQEKFRIEMAHQQTLRRKDSTMGVLTVAGLGVLVIALAFWVRMLNFRRRAQLLQLRSEEMEKQQLLNEIALLRTQVNPHFLFNSLSILSSLVQVNAGLAEQFIEQLSRSYRYILEQKEQSLVPLRTELEFIKAYSFLLQIRFENKFELHIAVPDDILDTRKIAPLTLQLLIENAVKHNRMSLKEPLSVTVFVENSETLVVKNKLQPRNTPAVSTGVGLQNIKDRYALLTERPVWAGETEEAFVVKVPLL
jgi:tetratricopeptide (TPR) repeat protein